MFDNKQDQDNTTRIGIGIVITLLALIAIMFFFEWTKTTEIPYLKTFVLLSLVSIAFGVGLFFLFRKILLWYWKINRIVELLESIDSKMDDREPGRESEGI